MDKHQTITRLRQLEQELHQRGVDHLSIFGSLARDEQDDHSDIDLAVTFRKDAKMDLFAFAELEDALSKALSCPVDLVKEPVTRKPRLQQAIDRERVHVF